MGKKYIFSLGFFFIFISLVGQTRVTKKLEGTVKSKNGDVAATHVLNNTSNQATITNIDGYFSLPVQLNDTLIFSAVQFKKKEFIVTQAVLVQKSLIVFLDDALTELEEVVVTPYNLTGNLNDDVDNLDIGEVVSASSLGLPNANVKPLMQSERLLREASFGPLTLGTFTSVPFNPIINAITGRTKMLKKRVARDKKYARTVRVRKLYSDSLFINDLKIPKLKIEDFMWFCEIDDEFQTTVDSHDHLKIWEFLRKKSIIYRKNNELD